MTSPTTDRRQGLVGNTPYKAPVTVVATTNIVLSGEQTIDAIAVKASNSLGVPDRVLCAAQTDGTQNGIYNVSTAAWTRANDADGNYDLVNGSQIYVSKGAANASSIWALVTDVLAIGTSVLTFSKSVSAAFLATLAAGSGAGLIGFILGLPGAVYRTLLAKLSDVPSIKDFGAVADGNIVAGTGTDNSPALNAAISALGVNGCLFVPAGVYLCLSQVAIPSEFTLYGAGKYCSILTAKNAFNSDGLLKCNGIGGAPTNIRGLGVIAQNGGAGASSQGINSVANGVFISDVWVAGFNTNVTLGSSDNFLLDSAVEQAASGGTGVNIPSTDVTVANVTIYACYIGMSVHDFAYLDGTVTVTNARFNACTYESILVSNASNVQFSGCSVGGSNSGQNSNAGINVSNSSNVSFDGMMARQAGPSTTAPGLLISGGSSISVNGGQFVGWLDGIQTSGVSGLTINGSQCLNNYRRGIYVSGGDRVVLTGGLCANDGSIAASDAGVYLLNSASSSLYSVTGWTCTQSAGGNQDYGIYANLTNNGASTGYITLTGNTCLVNNTADIALVGATQNINLNDNTAAVVSGAYVQISSASTVALPIVGSVFGIFGNTGITALANPIAGRRVTLLFSSSLVVTNGTGLQLAGSANVNVTAGSTLTFIADGTNWYEAGRSVH